MKIFFKGFFFVSNLVTIQSIKLLRKLTNIIIIAKSKVNAPKT